MKAIQDRYLSINEDDDSVAFVMFNAQASTTLNLYAHALPDHKKSSMEKMGEFYGK